MKLVLINTDFRDVYTGKIHHAGEREEMTDERIAEIRAVNAEFVSVIGSVPDKVEKDDKADKAEKKSK